ncbi:GNAT family N-acetyltransferase [Dokdonella sp.]|uniref:GNAT family N-acetyltransferase n=1 Tax=Dokdonella sp. TaxID=2291710 RepID=UPI0031C944F5|nr:GNAT family N-acetyltransferase [Dokdonella sp.]
MSHLEPRFRYATSGDIAAVRALVESAYRGEASRVGWTTEADLLDGQRTDVAEISELIDRPGSLILLAEAKDELLACVHLERMHGAAYLGMFSVHPGQQARGLGRRVLAECERIAAAEWGAREMRMTVIVQRSELIAWYERRGYVRTGITKPFPYGDARFGLPRRPDLRFEWLAKPLTSEAAA